MKNRMLIFLIAIAITTTSFSLVSEKSTTENNSSSNVIPGKKTPRLAEGFVADDNI